MTVALLSPNLVASRRWRRKGPADLVGPCAEADPLRAAVSRGLAAGNAKARPSAESLEQLRVLRQQAKATGVVEDAVRELLDLVSAYPRAEDLQAALAQLLVEAGDPRALACCLGVSRRFPGSMDAFDRLIRLVRHEKGASAAREVLQRRFPVLPNQFDQLLSYADAAEAAGDMEQAKAAFSRLAGIFARRRGAWLLTSPWLEEEYGAHRGAVMLLRKVAAGTGFGPPLIGEDKQVQRVVAALSGGKAPLVGRVPAASIRVLQVLFDRVLETRPAIPRPSGPRSGRLVLLTGSLGTGGAERQLTTTAIGLHQMDMAQRRLPDGLTFDKVDVVARALDDREDGSFYLGDLEGAGIEVQSYRLWPDFGGDIAASAVRPALRALGFLPWSTAEAVIKLTDRLRALRPELVHVWQDGMVYATGLAALLAGVPRIVLSGRSTPPPDRRDRYPVEYDIIYKSLLSAPGVRLSVNSHHAASRYARWLGIDPAEISVVPNGVEPLSIEGDRTDEEAYRAFLARTDPSALTLGGVMRLDQVKRPLLWMEAAAAIVARLPSARFIVVGAGPLQKRAEKRAQSLGIAHRCLFVGRSTRVGYWLSKMDALMLLSEHEGLPNALIEAQLAGVPVIATSAGGTPESVLPGVTGVLLDVEVSASEVAEQVVRLVQSGGLAGMGKAARAWASDSFPVRRMLSGTLDAYAATSRHWSVVGPGRGGRS